MFVNHPPSFQPGCRGSPLRPVRPDPSPRRGLSRLPGCRPGGFFPPALAALALLLAVGLLAGAPPAAGQEDGTGFTRHRLTLRDEFSDLHPFDLDGDGLTDLVVLEADPARSRDIPHRVRVFLQTAQGFRAVDGAEAGLPPHLSMAGVGAFRDGPGLALLTPAGVAVWPWGGGRFHPEAALLQPVASIFPVPPGELASGLDWVVDLDGDGRSELLVPRFDGVQILRQDAAGALVPHALLRIRPHGQVNNWFRGQVVAYDLPSIHPLQVDGKGWIDVAIYLRGQLWVFLLDGAPGPSERAPALALDLQPPAPFDPKTPYDPPLLLVAAQDLNGDGHFDLLFSKVSAADSQFNTRTNVLLHYGRAGRDGAPIAFSATPGQVFVSEGFTLPLLEDLDGDGRTDLVMVNVQIGFWNVIRALITRSVKAEAALYRMPAAGRYGEQPDGLETYSVSFSLDRFSHQPITAFADLNGDRLQDLLLSLDRERIGIHWGRADALWDDDPDTEWKDFMPINARRVRAADLNGDGREDLMFVYNRDDIRQMPEVNHTLTVLLSRFRIGPPPPRRPAPAGTEGAR